MTEPRENQPGAGDELTEAGRTAGRVISTALIVWGAIIVAIIVAVVIIIVAVAD